MEILVKLLPSKLVSAPQHTAVRVSYGKGFWSHCTVKWWRYKLYLAFFIDSIFVNRFIIQCMDSPDMILEAFEACGSKLTHR